MEPDIDKITNGSPSGLPLSRQQRLLLTSNGTDAASRSLSDFLINVIFVSTLGANAFELGLMNALGTLGFVLVSVPAGYLVDRFTGLRVLRFGLAGKVAIVVSLFILVVSDSFSVPVGIALATAMGICNVFTENSQVSVAADISHREVGQAKLTNLISQLTAADQTIGIIAPAAAGVLFAVMGAPPLLAAAVTLGGLALVTAGAIKTLATASNSAAPTTVKFSGALAGIGFIRANRKLLALTVLATCTNFGLAVFSAVEPILIIRFLELGPAWYGYLTALGGVGGVIGAVMAPAMSRRFSHRFITVLTTVIMLSLACLVVLAAFTSQFWAIFLLATQSLLWGVFVVAFYVATTSWATNLTPPELLGRTTSARRLFTFGVVPLGGLVGGLIGTVWGLIPAIVIWPVTILVGLMIYLGLTQRPETA
ncbi:MFS transporter [Micrococcoides hystricis]|uniref:MFS transporter n=1 Tax=Micrococcoides hystricis TaxID=1572761 RepID=A0ABV6PD53_9MICC